MVYSRNVGGYEPGRYTRWVVNTVLPAIKYKDSAHPKTTALVDSVANFAGLVGKVVQSVTLGMVRYNVGAARELWLQKNNLTAWSLENPIPDEMYWKGAAQHQLKGFKDLLAIAFRFDKNSILSVVCHHTSKSIKLPVVRLTLPSIGLNIWIRDNFHNFAVTVEAQREIANLDVSTMNMDSLHSCYFEGFERSNAPVYGSYAPDNSRFSFHYRGEDFNPIFERLVNAAVISGQREIYR